MSPQIKITRHAINRFNERIGSANESDMLEELYRARDKHLDVLGKRKCKHVFIPSPMALFVGVVRNGELIIKTVLPRGTA